PYERKPVSSSINPPSASIRVVSGAFDLSQLPPPSQVKKTLDPSCDIVRSPDAITYPKSSSKNATFRKRMEGYMSVITASCHVLPSSREYVISSSSFCT